ncbi:MAG: PAS domain-containing protein [Hyphomicrobium sp.]
MKHSANTHLYAYWNELRGDRLAPKRFEIEPSRMAAILPDTFILERLDTTDARFRLAGTRICEAFGAEFRGSNLFEMFEMEDRLTLQRQLQVVARQGAVGVFEITTTTASGKSVTFEMLILPLIHTRETVDRFLGCFAPLNMPAWIGIEPVANPHLSHDELVWPDGRPHAIVDHMRRQTPFAPHVRTARIVRVDRRQFRVYDGGLGKTDGDA